MAPRDIWDINPVFRPDFWWSYMDVLRMIGFIDDPEDENQLMMVVEEEEEEEEEEWELEDWGDDLHLLPSLSDLINE